MWETGLLKWFGADVSDGPSLLFPEIIRKF